MSKSKYKLYVVYKGKTPGVYKSWADCKAQIDGFSGAEYKGYKNEAEAEECCQRRTGKSLQELFGYDAEEEDIQGESDNKNDVMMEKIHRLQEKIYQDMESVGIPQAVEEFCYTYGSRDVSISMLSEAQKRAVGYIEGHSLLFAVPGSGKTAVIVARNGYMLHGKHNKIIEPDSIINLTFSRKAAAEMNERYRKIFPEDIVAPEFKTIHSFCLGHILGKLQVAGYKMPKTLLGSEYVDPETGNKKKLTLSMVVREALKKIDEPSNVDDETCQNISTAVTYIKNNMLAPKDYDGKILYLAQAKLDVAKFYAAYEEILHEKYNAYDFDDMLLYAYEGLQEYPEVLESLRQKYRYWSIDEAQDNSLLQSKLLNMLTESPNNLFMVGDDDQSIYSFRGAKPQLLLDYGLQESTVAMTMGVNYRSDRGIVHTAKSFIESNCIRADKNMDSFREAPGEIKFYTMMETPGLQYREVAQKAKQTQLKLQQAMETDECSEVEAPMAILYRHHYSAVPAAFWLYKYGVVFRMSKTLGEIMRGRIFFKAISFLDMLAHPCSYGRFIKGLASIGSYQLPAKLNAKQKKKLKQLAGDNPGVHVYKLYFQFIYDDIIEILKADYEAKKAKPKENKNLEDWHEFFEDEINKQELLYRIEKLQNFKLEWQEHFDKLLYMSTYDALVYMVENDILSYSEGRQSDKMRIYGLMAAAEAWNKPKEFIQAYREICYITDMDKNMEDDVHDGDMTDEPEDESAITVARPDIPVAVDMMTMHSSKGLQYDDVLWVDCLEESQMPLQENAFDTSDPEEERRLYYVAMTRARHELDIFAVQKYYGNKEEVSSYIREIADLWEEECQEQIIQYQSEDNIGSTGKICLLHRFYAVVKGYRPGIYESWEECSKNVEGFSGQEYKSFDTLEEAEAYYYGTRNEPIPEKLSAKFLENLILPQPIASFNRSVDLPQPVNTLICEYMHVDRLEEMAKLKYEKMDYKNVSADGFEYTDSTAATYLISYLPMNFYKIYLPLSKCLENLSQQNVMLMELGPGPGTSTLAMVMFYANLARENPHKQFSLDIMLIEQAEAFVKILKFMLSHIKPRLPKNMSIKGSIRPKDIKECLKNIDDSKYDLIYESNVFNKNESADRISYEALVGKLVHGLKKEGHGIFIEPESSSLPIWDVLQNNNDVYMLVSPTHAKVNVQGIALQKVALKAGIRYKGIKDHRFSYAVCQRI